MGSGVLQPLDTGPNQQRHAYVVLLSVRADTHLMAICVAATVTTRLPPAPALKAVWEADAMLALSCRAQPGVLASAVVCLLLKLPLLSVGVGWARRVESISQSIDPGRLITSHPPRRVVRSNHNRIGIVLWGLSRFAAPDEGETLLTYVADEADDEKPRGGSSERGAKRISWKKLLRVWCRGKLAINRSIEIDRSIDAPLGCPFKAPFPCCLCVPNRSNGPRAPLRGMQRV